VTDSAATPKAEAVAPSATVNGAAAKPAPPRTVQEVEADVEATRRRIAERIDGLTEYVSPGNIIGRQVDKAKSVFVDRYGGIKPERVLMAAGVVVGLVVLSALVRRRRHR